MTPTTAGPPGGGSASALSLATSAGAAGRVTLPVELHPVIASVAVSAAQAFTTDALIADTDIFPVDVSGEDTANQYKYPVNY